MAKIATLVQISFGVAHDTAVPQVDIASTILNEIDWDSVFRRLTIYAKGLVRQFSVFDGVSADDLVNETIVEFLANGSAWNPAKSTIERYLGGVLKNKYLEHIRRARHNVGSPIEGQVTIPHPTALNHNSERVLSMSERLRLVARRP